MTIHTVPDAVRNAELLKNYQTLNEIVQLEDNWNGNVASKFAKELLDTVRSIIENLFRQPEIYPSSRNNIQLEYINQAGDYLEFEIFENGMNHMFSYSHTGKMRTSWISAHMINHEVICFYEYQVS